MIIKKQKNVVCRDLNLLTLKSSHIKIIKIYKMF